MTEINRRPDADYSRLLDLSVLTTWTMDRQRVHHQDAAAYEEILALFQSALRSEVVDGDGRLSAPMRARKVEKHLRAAVKAARKQEVVMERFRLAVAAHQAHVKALPAQREAKQTRKAGRRAVAAHTAKSLHKSAAAFAPAPAEGTPAVPSTAPAARGINDLFNQRRGA
ncbi:hypothetical protein PV411_38725 [Streptomyces sp. NRRL_B-16638]|uniref:Alanine-rich protein n=1 Tax=Streptomyces coelicolor (strain ATCC BAA-471 / A3(2) / M145) TaxID=100226 RepID=Q8VWC9_STRCO|nr:alanine-rich protein [Streptomyces sp. NRRL_B-16638]MDX2930429.1 hypothetical protein [Streptomyces sp. NRRL_B-16638]CAD12018.1 putative alanine-rich protein [Streptomyces coelicolor A3(2)]